jgi:S-adenosylmethionine hydrolase
LNSPLITLTTDFGSTDPFVGAMKGVISSIHAEARIYDITHEVTPFDVLDGALIVAAATRYWPAGTIHVVVVDPGVGTARRPLLVSAGGHYFIAPDNGVLSLALDRETEIRAWHITEDKYFVHPISRTFHGRDVFAPSAAWLARTGQPESFGPEVTDYERFTLPRPQLSDRTIHGEILRADHFGNLLTNLRPEDAPHFATGGNFRLKIRQTEITRRISTFGEATGSELCVMLGSSGYFEIVVNRASAAQATGAAAGSPFTLEFS